MDEVLLRKMGERIRYARREMGLTQEKLAEKIGVSPSYMGHVERGSRAVSLEVLKALSEVLNMSMDVLVTGTHHEETMYSRSLSRHTLITDFVQFLEERDREKEPDSQPGFKPV